MSSFNKVIVMGNLTRTPELRSTGGGTQVCDISLAVNDYFTDASGKREERVTYVDITCWGKTAELVCRWKKQGDPVLVEGRLQQDKWVDKETGKNRTKLKVVAEAVKFVGRGGGEGGGGGGGEGGEGAGRGREEGGRGGYASRGGGGSGGYANRQQARPARDEPPADDRAPRDEEYDNYATELDDRGNPPF